MIDAHAHLTDRRFADDVDLVLERARHVGIERVLTAGEDLASSEAALALARRHDDVRVAVGVHPHRAESWNDDVARALAELARDGNVVAIGEIGLDYHYDLSPREVQQAVFRGQVRLARELQRPIVIHTREADEDTIAILRGEGDGEVAGVLHCFTGTDALATAGLELGLYVSLAGIITFPKAAGLRETVRRLPLERLLAETDSPFLAPVPYRGKRNEPAHVARVVEQLAALHGTTADRMAAQTTANFHTLFRP